MTILLWIIGIFIYLTVGKVVVNLIFKTNEYYEYNLFFYILTTILFPLILMWSLIEVCADKITWEIDWYIKARRIEIKKKKDEKSKEVAINS